MKDNDSTLINRVFGNRYLVIAVTACLIFILMGLLLDKLNRELDQVDQTHFEYRLAEIKAAIRLMEAEMMSQGGFQSAGKFDGANPMNWMTGDVSHYLGEVSPYEAIKSPGNWFYDPEWQEIAYVPKDIDKENYANNSDQNLEKILRFKVRALRSKEENTKFTGLALIMISRLQYEERL